MAIDGIKAVWRDCTKNIFEERSLVVQRLAHCIALKLYINSPECLPAEIYPGKSPSQLDRLYYRNIKKKYKRYFCHFLNILQIDLISSCALTSLLSWTLTMITPVLVGGRVVFCPLPWQKPLVAITVNRFLRSMKSVKKLSYYRLPIPINESGVGRDIVGEPCNREITLLLRLFWRWF